MKLPTFAVISMSAVLITSPAFAHEESIPIKYTCDGDDISPPLQWTDPPARVTLQGDDRCEVQDRLRAVERGAQPGRVADIRIDELDIWRE